MRIWFASLLGMTVMSAFADHRLEYTERDGSRNILEVGHKAVRMQEEGASQWMLYRQAEKSFYLVDAEQRSYQKMDQAAGSAMQAQLQALQEQMEAQLAGMPPEQREMMRQMMPQMPDLTKPAQYEVRAEGAEREVGGYRCQPVTVLKNGKPDEELCLGTPKALGISAADFSLLKGMGQLMGEVAASFGAGSMAAVLDRMDGLPVEHRAPGGEKAKAALTASRSGPLEAARFELPDGYQAREMFPGAGR